MIGGNGDSLSSIVKLFFAEIKKICSGRQPGTGIINKVPPLQEEYSAF